MNQEIKKTIIYGAATCAAIYLLKNDTDSIDSFTKLGDLVLGWSVGDRAIKHTNFSNEHEEFFPHLSDEYGFNKIKAEIKNELNDKFTCMDKYPELRNEYFSRLLGIDSNNTSTTLEHARKSKIIEHYKNNKDNPSELRRNVLRTMMAYDLLEHRVA